MSTINLTEQDKFRLKEQLENQIGITPGNGTIVTCHNCQHTWRYTGNQAYADCSQCRAKTSVWHKNKRTGKPGISIGACNAIRLAREHDHSYREINKIFSVINSPETARRHAIGNCQHTMNEIPPIRSETRE